MASFAVSAVDAGLAAAAAGAPGAGALNFTNLANGGNVNAVVSAEMLTFVAIVGTLVSVLSFLVPIKTFIIPVLKGKALSQRTMQGIVIVFFSCVVWALFSLPSMPDSTLVLIVNCIGGGIQIAYAIFFIWNAVGKKRNVSMVLFLAVVVLSVAVSLMVVFLIVRTHRWSTKVIAVIASTIATLTFVAGLSDTWIMFHNEEFSMSTLQLVGNLCSATIWSFYGFLFRPINVYIVVPNLTGVATTVAQLICHKIHSCKKRNAGAGNAGAAASNGVLAAPPA